MQVKEELLDIEGIKNSNKPLIDLFIRRTAVLTSTSEALTEKIIKDQWRNANKVMQADSPVSEVDFCNLGTFYISQNKARKRIKKITKYQDSMMKESVTRDEKRIRRNGILMKSNEELIKSIKFKTKQDVQEC